MNAVVMMIEAASTIILAIIFLALLGERLEGSFWRRSIAFGLVFAATGILVMLNPVELMNGVRTDPRNAVVALSAALGGPVCALITAVPMIALRLHFGGVGAVPGAASIASAAICSSLLWYAWTKYLGREASQRYILYHALSAAVVPALVIGVMTAVPWEIFLKSASLFVPVNFVAVLLMGQLVIREYQRRWAMAANNEAQARLQATANNAPGVLFQIARSQDGQLDLRYISDGARRILDMDPEDFVQDPTKLTRLISRQDGEKLRLVLEDSAETLEPWAFEAQCMHPRGRILWVRAVAEPRGYGDDEIVWDGFAYDISDQKRSERMKNDFISTVSHELRTPLTAIHGALGLVAAGGAGQLSAKGNSLVSIAYANSARLVRLINDILDIERIESGRMHFDIRPLAIRPLLEAAVEALCAYAAELEVSIEIEETAPGLVCLADQDRLSQAFVNLISNAVKFSPSGGTVRIRIAQRAGRARIYVSDEGPGIPQEFHTRIFTKFERANFSDNQKVGGTGLGLSITKAIIEHLNGEIDFRSTEGGGTIFFVDLPSFPAMHQLAAERDSRKLASA
ncbi:ATP-binding protein [Afifella sp. H1R]|uniref:ATP-binding protein n=1 Tax=Afifella sp. H1R TaxID=2908841 RepID=UPI001F474BD9|nr:ATP-binding protein [Afifella sp. H1R]MCF1502421.1 ATP-binding protein [Afifella sp. H1R]